ncbi:MAG: DUF4886 domain-containing protein [Verrucomicrobiaceae bacterium]|nr:DUF4886 domain-containing protein [Verrucomicrobiaceae bacterium]
MHFRSLLILHFLSLLALSATAAPSKILFVGNSYTGQVRSAVTKFFAASAHRETRLEFITPGGRTLKQHSEEAKTVERISGGGWDIVVLQDQSQTPAVFPEKFLSASKRLNQVITESGAKTAYYQTWGRRDGDKQNAERFGTYTKMQDALTKSYAQAAKRDKAILIPVGEVWRAVRKSDAKLGRELYKGDGSHPSAKGAYLVACCFYATLTGSDPLSVKFDGGLPAAQARAIREITRQAVSGRVPAGS